MIRLLVRRHARELGLKDDYMRELAPLPPTDANKENRSNKPGWRPGQGGWPDVEIRLPHGLRPKVGSISCIIDVSNAPWMSVVP